jgi:hypothetical protein
MFPAYRTLLFQFVKNNFNSRQFFIFYVYYYTDDTSATETLHNILESLVDGNVMSIVIIGLMICLIILLFVLITWIYMFVESLDPSASSAFYRGFSTKRPIPGNQSANILAHHEG